MDTDREEYVKGRFTQFLEQFDDTENNERVKYTRIITTLVESGRAGVIDVPVSLQDIGTFDLTLMDMILTYPADSLVFIDECLNNALNRIFEGVDIGSIKCRGAVHEHPNQTPMRTLSPDNIECLVAVQGVLTRMSQIIPDMRKAAFRCTAKAPLNRSEFCGHVEEVEVVNGEIAEPTTCPKCSTKYSLQLYHQKCTFGNKQLLKIQENPESIPEGETPHTILAYAYEELVDSVNPGDRIIVTGIYRVSGVRVVPKRRSLKSVYRTFIDAVHIEQDSKNRMKNEASHNPAEVIFDPADELKFQEMAKSPTIMEDLLRSVAPSIWEADDIKKGLLCQLFGGVPKKVGDRESRSDIHILLCGDPSTAKSQLLQYLHKLAPRGVYTVGRGSTAVGLTAAVSKDPETGEYILESGAIVLSDKGLCCIDEFDKMNDSTRSLLHEVMEQQTVSIAKAGIVCSLKARTAVLASANPIGSRYDPSRSVVENLNLPPSLLSRFDLVYLMLDVGNEGQDRQLATHICSLYSTRLANIEPPIDRKVFARYVSYARSKCFPSLGEDAVNALVSTYVEMRASGGGMSSKSVSATPRQLESLIRISESLARMQLRPTVLPSDVEEASRLMKAATYKAMIDPTTGRIDFQQLSHGLSSALRARRETLESEVIKLLKAEKTLDKDSIIKALNEVLITKGLETLNIQTRELETLMRHLENSSTVVRKSASYVLVT